MPDQLPDPLPDSLPGLQLITAVPTPFGPDRSLDLVGVRTLLARVADYGVDGVLVAGTNGEFVALSDAERLAVVEAALEVWPNADGVFAHVGAATTYQAVALTRASVGLGARRLAALTPYYHPASRQVVLDHFRSVADAAGGVPVYAYLFESLTNTRVDVPLMAELATIPGLAGVKVSGAPVDAVAAYRAALPPGFAVYSGADIDLARVHRIGGTGVVSGVSAAFPAPFLDLAAAVRAGDEEAEKRAQAEVDTVVYALSGGVASLKAALDLLGLPAGPVRVGVDPPSAQEYDHLRRLTGR
ncbi:4-hydroxy-tetrahydrodipicolinate synthase [Actinopolymorpha cephalotaxi]|uniref:4-hydroxy-tetrahydrodipicolinate synthase n=1 Tax=Actinopolymorpha cephalotaxi TaxID=504797 RepID=A0A1I3AL47_9ACTN|nr:dihydrodipicolinate synthase family protein [Actinopolymorpha cephalotaxi]NYH82214.1 4-hydroxy-tetrahydrodipicolinate synthase [Actinopolymorpha cephalotaxi]SFH50730.1 4-hydroxy-tetrahydrodipicolinate synthase [Actinopolymorpha cephalotaxi]